MKNHRWLKNPGWYCGSSWKHHCASRPLEEVTNSQQYVILSSCHYVIISLHYDYHAIMSPCWEHYRVSRPLQEVTIGHWPIHMSSCHLVIMSSSTFIMIILYISYILIIMSSWWGHHLPSLPLEKVTTSQNQSENRSDCQSEKNMWSSISEEEYNNMRSSIWHHQPLS